MRFILAQNIRRIRLGRGLSQEKLAERAGLHRTYVGSVERAERNISIDNIEALAIALRVDITELFAGTRKQ
jgi:transcriptional regulator with XRE-family HTH domain